MYDLVSLSLPLDVLSQGGPAIATKSQPIHPYRDGHSVKEEITGRRVTVVFPAAGYQSLDVKVSDPVDALTPLLGPAKTVNVGFDGFEAKVYDFTDRVTGARHLGISAKATAVRVVPAPGFDDLDVAINIE